MRSMKFTDLFSFESIILTVVLPVGTLLNCERSSCCVQSFHGTWQSNYIMCDELGLFDHSILYILYHSIKSALSLFTKSLCQNIGFNLHHLMRKGRSPKIEIALNLWDFAQQSFHWIEEKCKIKVAFRPNLCAWWTSIIFAKFPHDPLNMYGWFPEKQQTQFSSPWKWGRPNKASALLVLLIQLLNLYEGRDAISDSGFVMIDHSGRGNDFSQESAEKPELVTPNQMAS